MGIRMAVIRKVGVVMLEVKMEMEVVMENRIILQNQRAHIAHMIAIKLKMEMVNRSMHHLKNRMTVVTAMEVKLKAMIKTETNQQMKPMKVYQLPIQITQRGHQNIMATTKEKYIRRVEKIKK